MLRLLNAFQSSATLCNCRNIVILLMRLFRRAAVFSATAIFQTTIHSGQLQRIAEVILSKN